MKQPYIVYYHIGKELCNTTVRATSSIEATSIVEKRFKKNKHGDCGVDGTSTITKEQKIMDNREPI